MVDSADPDEILHSAASDLGQKCLNQPVCPNSVTTVYLGFLFRVSNSINFILYLQMSYYNGVLNS